MLIPLPETPQRIQLLGRYLKGVQLEGGLTLEDISKRLSGAPAECKRYAQPQSAWPSIELPTVTSCRH